MTLSIALFRSFRSPCRFLAPDGYRVAEAERIGLRCLRPDSIGQDLRTLHISPEPQRIRRPRHLGAAVARAGLDHIDVLLWRLRQHGLHPRAASPPP